jgi:hypothetical protein
MERDVAVIQRRKNLIVRRAQRILSYVNDAPALAAAGGVPPEDWDKTARDYKVRVQVATDANKSKRHAPIYLEYAKNIVENAEKLEMLRNTGAPVQLNIAAVHVVQPAPQYQEIVVQALPPKEDK